MIELMIAFKVFYAKIIMMMISSPNSYGFKRDIINPTKVLLEDFGKAPIEDYITKKCDGNIIIDRPKCKRIDAFLNQILKIEDTKIGIFDDILKAANTIHKGFVHKKSKIF